MNLQKLTHIAELFPEAVLLISKRAEIVYANEEAIRLIQMPRQELQKTFLFSLDEELDLSTIAQRFDREGIQEGWQRKWSIADDKKIEVTIDSMTLPVDGKDYLLLKATSSLQESTSKPSAKEATSPVLATPFSEGNLSKLAIDHLPIPILWIRQDGYVIYSNRSACEALQSEDIINRSITQIDTETTLQQWQNYWKRLKNQKEQIQFESYLQRTNQTILFAELTLTLLEAADQQIMNIVVTDIGRRRLEEAELQHSLIESENLRQRLESIRKSVARESNIKIITQNKEYLKLIDRTMQVAKSDASVLIFGETGTGKELLANLIHEESDRKTKPFVKINCAAISPQLLESELFGHEKGAFTNAHKRKLGRLEIADNGTVFLDEIGELPLEMQSKLLRVLQSGEFERVGGTETITIDIRLVSATNRNLTEMIEEKRFRSDLYYRIATFPIENIALRDRKDDISLLAQYFVDKYSRKVGKKIEAIHEVDIKRLRRYAFPGNIRELENLIERSVILTNDRFLDLSHWQSESSQFSANGTQTKTFEEVQRDCIIDALKRTDWKIAGEDGAAHLLDLNPKTLSSKMRKLGIKRPM